MKTIFKIFTVLLGVFCSILPLKESQVFTQKKLQTHNEISSFTLSASETMKEGDVLSVGFHAQNATFAAIEFSIYYDENLFYIEDWGVPYSYVSLDEDKGESFLYNIETPGVINLTYVFFGDKTFENTRLGYFNLTSKSGSIDFNTNTYIDVVVGKCINANLEDVNITNRGTSLNIKNQEVFLNNPGIYLLYFESEFYLGEEYTFEVCFSGTAPISCGEIYVNYDPEVFELTHFQYNILDDMALKDYNASSKGLVSVNFVSSYNLEPGWALFSLTFRTIATKETKTEISLEAKNFSNSNYDLFSNTLVKTTFVLLKNPNYIPFISLSAVDLGKDKTFSTKLSIGRDTAIGAADFVISFPKTAIKLKSYTKFLHKDYILGVNDKNKEEGLILASLLSLNGLFNEYDLIEFNFEIIGEYLDADIAIEITPSNVVDSSFNDLYLDVINCYISHQHYGKDVIYQEPTCSLDGYRAFTCDICSEYIFELLEKNNNHTHILTIFDEENGEILSYCRDCRTIFENRPIELIDYVNEWIQTYLYMDSISVDDQGTGRCLGTNGYYQKAKKALIELEEKHPGVMLEFYNNGNREAYERFIAWATANGETFDPINATINKTLAVNNDIIKKFTTKNVGIPIIICCLASVLLLTLFVLKRRNTR